MTSVMPSGLFGPWAIGTDETERRAGLRTLAALTAVFADSDHPAVAALRSAEMNITASSEALVAFDGLPALKRSASSRPMPGLCRPGRLAARHD